MFYLDLSINKCSQLWVTHQLFRWKYLLVPHKERMGALIREGRGIDRRVLACVLVLFIERFSSIPFHAFFPYNIWVAVFLSHISRALTAQSTPDYLGLAGLVWRTRCSRDLERAKPPRKAWTTGGLPFTLPPLGVGEEKENLKMSSRDDREAEKEEMLVVGLDAAFGWQ